MPNLGQLQFAVHSLVNKKKESFSFMVGDFVENIATISLCEMSREVTVFLETKLYGQVLKEIRLEGYDIKVPASKWDALKSFFPAWLGFKVKYVHHKRDPMTISIESLHKKISFPTEHATNCVMFVDNSSSFDVETDGVKAIYEKKNFVLECPCCNFKGVKSISDFFLSKDDYRCVKCSHCNVELKVLKGVM